MNKFISKKILPSLLGTILSLFNFSWTFATSPGQQESTGNSKAATESFGSKISNGVKKVIYSPRFLIPASILSVLSAPSVYSNIKHSKPRDITNIQGETDEEISGYVTHRYSLEETLRYMQPAQKEIFKNKINEILQEMYSAGCTTDYEKAIFLHDYIYKNCKYDTGHVVEEFLDGYCANHFVHTADACLLNNCAVCDGISAAYNILCGAANMECKVIDGSSLGMGHAWNLVEINGQWYHVDVTLDLFLKATHGKYAWFMRSKQEMRWNHTPDKPYVLTEQDMVYIQNMLDS